MQINHKLVNEHGAEVQTVNGHAVVLLPLANGFQKMIAYFSLPTGGYRWVHRDFRKQNRRGKKRE